MVIFLKKNTIPITTKILVIQGLRLKVAACLYKISWKLGILFLTLMLLTGFSNFFL